MELSFEKSTDTEHEIKLDSYLISAFWDSRKAIAGKAARLEVHTAFVGEGAKIKVSGKTEGGTKLGKADGVIKKNVYVAELNIPEDAKVGDLAYFEVELPKNKLKGESNRIPVYPKVEVTNMKWSAQEARRGDLVTLTADANGLLDASEVTITIWEFDTDRAHDNIAEIPTVTKGNKIEVQWEYEYHEDTDEIPTQEELDEYGGKYNHPEYFFTVKVENTVFGKSQESGLLKFKDWLEVVGEDPYGEPLVDGEYVITLPDGTEKKGKLDGDGYAKVTDIPPGVCHVELKAKEEDDADDESTSQTAES